MKTLINKGAGLVDPAGSMHPSIGKLFVAFSILLAAFLGVARLLADDARSTVVASILASMFIVPAFLRLHGRVARALLVAESIVFWALACSGADSYVLLVAAPLVVALLALRFIRDARRMLATTSAWCKFFALANVGFLIVTLVAELPIATSLIAAFPLDWRPVAAEIRSFFVHAGHFRLEVLVFGLGALMLHAFWSTRPGSQAKADEIASRGRIPRSWLSWVVPAVGSMIRTVRSLAGATLAAVIAVMRAVLAHAWILLAMLLASVYESGLYDADAMRVFLANIALCALVFLGELLLPAPVATASDRDSMWMLTWQQVSDALVNCALAAKVVALVVTVVLLLASPFVGLEHLAAGWLLALALVIVTLVEFAAGPGRHTATR
jgi:hypothetical protein